MSRSEERSEGEGREGRREGREGRKGGNKNQELSTLTTNNDFLCLSNVLLWTGAQ